MRYFFLYVLIPGAISALIAQIVSVRNFRTIDSHLDRVMNLLKKAVSDLKNRS